MTTFEIDPEDIISDFLRIHLLDPQSRAETSNTETFTALSGQTDFSLTSPVGSVSCVTSVTVEGVTKKKWLDFFWDYQNSKLTFFSGLSLSDEVIITYKYGASNWIFSDRPDQRLKESGFPRISIFNVSGSARRLGQYDAPMESSIMLQIDTWAKNGQIFTINGKKYSNEYYGRYLSRKVTKAFEDNEEDLFPVLYNYNCNGGPREAPYTEEFQAHHTVTEVNLKGLRLGRIEKWAHKKDI